MDFRRPFDTSSNAGQKPVKEEFAILDFLFPPSTPAEMATQVDAIVLATFDGEATTLERALPGNSPVRWTSYPFTVIDIVKGHPLLPPPGARLEVLMLGGDKEYQAYVHRLRISGTDLLRGGMDYLVFFKYDLINNELDVAWGPAGSYELTTEPATNKVTTRLIRVGIAHLQRPYANTTKYQPWSMRTHHRGVPDETSPSS